VVKGNGILDYEGQLAVEFQTNIGGHNCSGMCKEGYGYYIQKQYLKKLELASDLIKKQWITEWEPKLRRKRHSEPDPIILIEE
jgi:hypothetical protein